MYIIRAQNEIVKMVEFLKCQEPEEAASEFIRRVKGRAKVCEFIVVTSPTAEDSVQDMSCFDKVSSHVTMRGLEDIQDSDIRGT